MTRFLLLLLAGFAGWRFLIRPWFSKKDQVKVEDDPRFHGEQVKDADFEDLDDGSDREGRS
jgi:hypothetical protein